MNKIQKLITDHIVLWTSAEVEKQSSRGRAGGFSEKIYGIQRLRQLILELASQGRLVPQDADDESAMDLYKKIQVERGGLELNQAIGVETLPSLPKGWLRVPIQSLFKIVYGKGLSNSELTNEGYDVFGANGIIGKYSSYVYEAPQLLISCRGAYSGKPNISPPFCFVTSNSLVLESTWTNLSQSYFYHALSIADKKKIVTGSAQPQVTTTNLGPFLISLPPLAEQHRIVAKVDELMALCDELENKGISSKSIHKKLVESVLDALVRSIDNADFEFTWKRIVEIFEVLFLSVEDIDLLKKCILRLAISGRLVKQIEGDHPIDVLLKSLRERGSEKSIGTSKKNEGNLPPLAKEEMPFQIPKSWRWVRAREICRSISSGSTPAAEYLKQEGDIPFLKVYNIREQQIDFDYQKQFVDSDIHHGKLKRSRLYPGDVVMNIVGPPLGKVAIIPSTYEEWNCNQAIAFFGLLPPLKPEYFYFFLCEGSYLNEIELIGTAGQDNISVTKSQNIPVPLPPPEEQERIALKINELFSICDKFQSHVINSSKLQRKVADALVEQALA